MVDDDCCIIDRGATDTKLQMVLVREDRMFFFVSEKGHFICRACRRVINFLNMLVNMLSCFWRKQPIAHKTTGKRINSYSMLVKLVYVVVL